jgi:CHASE3 domain sensor protein
LQLHADLDQLKGFLKQEQTLKTNTDEVEQNTQLKRQEMKDLITKYKAATSDPALG